MEKPSDTGFLEGRGYDLVTQRNSLAEHALKTDAEFMFWLDDDMIGPSNALTSLITHRGLLNAIQPTPILAGLYMSKKAHGARGLAAWQKSVTPGKTPWEKESFGYVPIVREQKGRFISVDVTGLGCCLIHRSVFEKLSRPWFEWGEPTSGPSEDFMFFEKVWRELKVKPVVDMECKFEHIGVFKMNVDGEFNPI